MFETKEEKSSLARNEKNSKKTPKIERVQIQSKKKKILINRVSNSFTFPCRMPQMIDKKSNNLMELNGQKEDKKTVHKCWCELHARKFETYFICSHENIKSIKVQEIIDEKE